MLFLFFAGNQSLNGDDYTVEIAPSIKVKIPGYDGIWADKTSETGRYDIQGLSGDNYKFVPEILMPRYWTTDATGTQSVEFRNGVERINRLEMFGYIKDSAYRAIVPGIDGQPAIWSPSGSHTMGIPSYGASGDWAAVIMPFDGVTIPEGSTSVTFSVQWDLDGIIEVYDHGTANDKTDDVIVLAKNFWERFSLVPTVVE